MEKLAIKLSHCMPGTDFFAFSIDELRIADNPLLLVYI